MQHVLLDSIQLPHQSGIVGHNATATLRLQGHQLSRQLDIASIASIRHANKFVSPLLLFWRSRALAGYLGKFAEIRKLAQQQ